MNYKDKLYKLQDVEEIIHMLFEVQNSGKATIFIRLSGHVGLFEVDIHEPAWTVDSEPSYCDSIYLCEGADMDGFKARLIDYINSIS